MLMLMARAHMKVLMCSQECKIAGKRCGEQGISLCCLRTALEKLVLAYMKHCHATSCVGHPPAWYALLFPKFHGQVIGCTAGDVPAGWYCQPSFHMLL